MSLISTMFNPALNPIGIETGITGEIRKNPNNIHINPVIREAINLILFLDLYSATASIGKIVMKRKRCSRTRTPDRTPIINSLCLAGIQCGTKNLRVSIHNITNRNTDIEIITGWLVVTRRGKRNPVESSSELPSPTIAFNSSLETFATIRYKGTKTTPDVRLPVKKVINNDRKLSSIAVITAHSPFIIINRRVFLSTKGTATVWSPINLARLTHTG